MKEKTSTMAPPCNFSDKILVILSGYILEGNYQQLLINPFTCLHTPLAPALLPKEGPCCCLDGSLPFLLLLHPTAKLLTQSHPPNTGSCKRWWHLLAIDLTPCPPRSVGRYSGDPGMPRDSAGHGELQPGRQGYPTLCLCLLALAYPSRGPCRRVGVFPPPPPGPGRPAGPRCCAS